MPYTLQEAVKTRDHAAAWLHDVAIPEEYRDRIVKELFKLEKPEQNDFVAVALDFIAQWEAGVARDDAMLEKTALARKAKLTGIEIFSAIVADHPL